MVRGETGGAGCGSFPSLVYHCNHAAADAVKAWGKLGLQCDITAGAQMTESAPESTQKVRRNSFTALEIAAQVDTVRDWLAEGLRPNKVRQRCSDAWGLTSRVADSRIFAARRSMVQDLESVDRKEKAAELLEAAADILAMARETRQLSNAIGALSFQARLLGLEGRQN